MTNKDRKNKIRQRMAETGESWAEAHRVITHGAEHAATSRSAGARFRLIGVNLDEAATGQAAGIHEVAGRPLREALNRQTAGISAAWARSALGPGAAAQSLIAAAVPSTSVLADRQAAAISAAMKMATAGHATAIHEATGRGVKLSSLSPTGSGMTDMLSSIAMLRGPIPKDYAAKYQGLATPVRELTALAEMLERGLLTREEFDGLKARILQRRGGIP
jgi:hypothetical protein